MGIERLFDRFRRRGDARALATVFDRTAVHVRRVARHLARDAFQADDLVQRTYLTAIESAASFDARRPLVPWLLGILGNHARESARRDGREIDPARLAAPACLPPDVASERSEDAAEVARAIDALPDPSRAVAVLRWRYGHEPREIADALGMSPSTVRSHLRRGLARLRRAVPTGLGAAVVPFEPSAGLEAVRAAVLEAAARAAGRTTPPAAAGGTFAKAAVALLAVATAVVAVAARDAPRVRPAEAAPAPSPAAAAPTSDVGALLLVSARAVEDTPPPEPREPPPAPVEPPAALERAPAPPASPIEPEPTGPGLHVRVLDADGAPSAGAEVVGFALAEAFGFEGPLEDVRHRAVADAHGRAKLQAASEGRWSVVARGAESGFGAASHVLVDPSGTSVVVRLGPDAAIAGRVTDESGLGLAGASVATDLLSSLRSTYGTLFRERLRLRWRMAVKTAEDGSFRLQRLGTGPHSIDFAAPSLAARTIDSVWAPAEHLVVVLPEGGVVTGSVESTTGSLPSEVRVWTDPPSVETTVPAEGGEAPFTLEGVPAGSYRVLARGRGTQEATRSVRVEPRVGSEALRLFLGPGAPVSGTVRSGLDGAPLAGVEISLAYLGPSGASASVEDRVVTDASGGWSASLRAGTWVVTAKKDGFVPPEGEEFMRFSVASSAVRRDLTLVPSPAIVGTVVFPDGEPAVGATVAVTGAEPVQGANGRFVSLSSDMQTETDASGRFRLAGVATHVRHTVTAWASPAAPPTKVEDVLFEPGSSTAELHVVVARPASGTSVSGSVADETGVPVEGALVIVGGRTARTDPDGAFSLEGIPPGRYRARISAVGYAVEILPPIVVSEGKPLEVPPWTLHRHGLRVRGRVTTPSDAPLEGAKVFAIFPDLLVLSARTDADGAYALEGPVTTGVVDVQVRFPGRQVPSVHATLGPDTVVDVVVPGYGSAAGTLSFAGAPPASVTALVWPGLWPADVEWDRARGDLTLRRIRPGPSRIVLRADGYATLPLPEVSVREGETVALESMRMTRGGSISGRVLDATGAPIADVRVSLGDLHLYTDTGASGGFRLPHVPPGSWTVRVQGIPGREKDPPEFLLRVVEAETTEAVLRVPPR
jgi:RNA polymerase sigma-70 factor (ECF subfamily)